MEPIRRPPTWTSSSFTSWPAFWNTRLYSCVPPPRRRSTATSTIASARAATATPLATLISSDPLCANGPSLGARATPCRAREAIPHSFTSRYRPGVFAPGLDARLLHAERAARGTREELAHEHVVRVEQLLRGSRLDDPALPQHGDVLRDALRGHDVVGDHDVGAAVLLVDLLDQLAQERCAHRVEAGVGLVEEHDVGVQHERPREAGALAHAARELVGHLVVRPLETDLAQAPRDDLLDLVLALVRVLAQGEADVVEQVHRAEQRAVLEEDAELLAHVEEVVVGHVRHGLAVDEHVAVVGIEQPHHVLDADGLPGPRRAEDHRDLALGDAHVEAAQDLVAPERLVDLDELDGVRDPRRALRARVPLVLVVGVALAVGRLEPALVLRIVLGARLGLHRRVGRLLARLVVLLLGRLPVDVVALVALLAGGLLRRRLLARRAPPPRRTRPGLPRAAVPFLPPPEEASHVCLLSTADGCAWVGAPEELRPKHSDEVHEHDVQHHGLGRGGSHPDRAAARVVPVVAAHEHDAGRHRHALDHAV